MVSLSYRKETTGADFDIDSEPTDSDYMTYDIGMFTLPTDICDIGIDFSYRICCTAPIYLEGSTESTFHFGTNNGLDSVTTYKRIQPENPGKTYAYIGLGFGAIVLFGVYGTELGLMFSGVGGDRVVVNGNDTLYEKAVTREGKVADQGIIHYCAASEYGLCLTGEHGALRTASLSLVVAMIGNTQTLIDWNLSKGKDDPTGFYYSRYYSEQLEEAKECPHKAFQVEADDCRNPDVPYHGSRVYGASDTPEKIKKISFCFTNNLLFKGNNLYM